MKGTAEMKRIIAAATALGIAFTMASCGKKAAKSPNDFALVNNIGTPISEVYISESANDDWGQNILGTTVLENGKTLDVAFSGAATSTNVFDIAVFTNGGTEYQFKSLDLNTASVITLEMQDNAPVASVQQ